MLFIEREHQYSSWYGPAVIEDYTAQADFLIAYFHLLLMKCYGPTVLVKETPKFDTPRENYLSRMPYDECVAWVAGLFDDAACTAPRNTGRKLNMDLPLLRQPKHSKHVCYFMRLRLFSMEIVITVISRTMTVHC